MLVSQLLDHGAGRLQRGTTALAYRGDDVKVYSTCDVVRGGGHGGTDRGRAETTC